MKSRKVLLMVGSDITPEREKEFNEWYDKTHLPMILDCPGMVKATRYQLVEPALGFPEYLTIYELANEASAKTHSESAQLQAARKDRLTRFSDTELSVRWHVYYKQVTP